MATREHHVALPALLLVLLCSSALAAAPAMVTKTTVLTVGVNTTNTVGSATSPQVVGINAGACRPVDTCAGW